MEEKEYNPFKLTSPISGEAVGIDECLGMEADFIATEGYKDSEKNLKFRQYVLKFLQIHSKELPVEPEEFDAFIPYLALNYVDRFISKRGLPGIFLKDVSKDLDLLAMCCLLRAGMLRDQNFNRFEFLEEIEQEGLQFEDEKIVDMDIQIVGVLGWRMEPITAFCFLEHFSSKFPFCSYNPGNIQELIIQSHADIYLAELKPSVIAASALLVGAREHLDASEHDVIRNTFIHDFEMKEEQLDLCSAKMKEHCDKREIPIAVVRWDSTRAPGSAQLSWKGKQKEKLEATEAEPEAGWNYAPGSQVFFSEIPGSEVGEASSLKEAPAESQKLKGEEVGQCAITFAELAEKGVHEIGFEINWVDENEEVTFFDSKLKRMLFHVMGCFCLMPK